MTSRPRILLINPNTVERVTETMAAEARIVAGDDAEIRAVTAPFGAGGIENLAEATIAAHAVLVRLSENLDCDAAIVAAFMDPGLDALREIDAMPAVGLGEAGFRAAAAGRRFALVTVARNLRPAVDAMVARLGLGDRLAGMRYVDATVPQLAIGRSALLPAIAAVARDCVEQDGAEAILFGGAIFAGVHRDLGDAIGVPLVDGIGAATREAVALARAAPSPVILHDPPGKASVGLSEALARLIDRPNRR